MDFTLDSKTDEDFFGALKRQNTNLEHLFEFETQRSGGGQQQESLKYQPTKQTSSNNSNTNKGVTAATTTTTVQAWQTLLAKVANAYKEGVPVGKVGVALLQNTENEYRIIIYKAKLNVLATCSLRAEMAQVHLNNNYLQFYDDELRCWSIYFDTETGTEEFVSKLTELKFIISEGEKQEHRNAILELEIVSQNNVESATSNQANAKEAAKPPIVTTKPTKTALITRMSKMGQQLPKLSPAPHLQSSVEATDSSDAEIISIAAPQLKHQSMSRSSSRTLAKTQTLPISHIEHYASTATNGTFETQFMQMMLSENRTHSSELRMNINRLESKVERVIDKIDLLHASSGDQLHKEDEMLALEEKVLELKKENRKLRLVIEGKSESKLMTNRQPILQSYSTDHTELNLASVDSLEQLVGDLLRQRAALHEKLEEWERDLAEKNAQLKTHQCRIDDDQDMLAKTIAQKEQLEETLRTLEKRLAEKEKIENDLRLDLAESNKEFTAQKQQYEEIKQNETEHAQLEEDVETLQNRLADKEKIESDLRHQVAASNKECIEQRQLYEESKQKEMQANILVRDLQEQNIKLQRNLAENAKTEDLSDLSSEERLSVEQQIETVLKKTMNNLYASLATKIENIVPAQKNAVIAIVGKTIREETLKAMDELTQK